MGLNAYLAAVGSIGRTNGSATASTITANIDGSPGRRIVIRAWGATPAETATHIYFMQCLEKTTVSAAIASNATTLTVTAFSTAPVTGANIVIELDDGTRQWTTVASTASTTSVPIASALTDTVAAANNVYDLGLYSDTGHYKYALTASTQATKEVDGGMFYGTYRGAPMRVHIHSAGSGTASIDYVSYGYINL